MQSVLEAYQDMPPVTRAYTTACVLTTLAVVGDESEIPLFNLSGMWEGASLMR